jgi:pimeloyl-ACP methyl ester carboxylesterase
MPSASGYAAINGLQLYYEQHGHGGQPLLLLHGGLGAIEMFGEVLPALARDRQVIAVDLQAHGRTADADRPLSFEGIADDLAALVGHLGLGGSVDALGYSLGGGAALRLAIQHPALVRKLVLVSTPFRKSGWYPELQAGQAQMSAAIAPAMQQTPLYASYARLAPRVEDWPVLLQKLGDLLRRDYDWSADLERITAQTLLVLGDADGIPPRHMVEFYERLGGGLRDAGWDGSSMARHRLAILPGLTHYTIFAAPRLAETAAAFLDAPPAGG